MSNPYGYTIFCDDIREEVGAKQSFMGRYVSEMVISAKAPIFLPKFAAAVHLILPLDLKFDRIKVALQMDAGGETTTMQEVNLEMGPPEAQEGIDHFLFGANFVLAPLSVPGDCFLRVRGYIDEEREVKCGSLRIRFAEQPS